MPRLTCIEKGNYDVSASLADERLDRERHGALVERGIYLAKFVSRIKRSFKKLEWRSYIVRHYIVNTCYQRYDISMGSFALHHLCGAYSYRQGSIMKQLQAGKSCTRDLLLLEWQTILTKMDSFFVESPQKFKEVAFITGSSPSISQFCLIF